MALRNPCETAGLIAADVPRASTAENRLSGQRELARGNRRLGVADDGGRCKDAFWIADPKGNMALLPGPKKEVRQDGDSELETMRVRRDGDKRPAAPRPSSLSSRFDAESESSVGRNRSAASRRAASARPNSSHSIQPSQNFPDRITRTIHL